MSQLQPLTGQTVLVTGASGGIGAAIVERLSAEGARPVIHYGRDRPRAEALLHKLGGNGLIVQADLSRPDGAFALWCDALSAAGRIHAVVKQCRGSATRFRSMPIRPIGGPPGRRSFR